MDFPSFDERLNLARERIGAATTPAERAARTTGQPPVAPIRFNGQDFTPTQAPQGYVGADGSGPTQAQQDTYLERTMSTPAIDPALATGRMAPPPAGMMANPAATNFGRLSAPRTDLPAYVPAATQATARASTMLPTGNIAARNAVMRSAMPNATPSELTALGNMAWNRPAAFNAAMAGTRLDPAAASERTQQHEASLAATRARTAATLASPALDPYQRSLSIQHQELGLDQTRQGMKLTAEEAARRAAGDTATQNFFSETDNAAIAAAARAGAPAQTLFDMHQVATQRAEEARRLSAGAATPREAAQSVPPGAAAQLSQTATGRWVAQFQMPGATPEVPKTELGKLAVERARAVRDNDPTLVDLIDQRMKMITTRPLTKEEQLRREEVAEKNAARGTPAPAAKPAQPSAAAKPAATAANLTTPSQAHIAHLRQNPSLASQFDAKFGPGAAKRALGQ